MNRRVRAKDTFRLKTIEESTKDMIYHLSLTSVGSEQLRSWTRRSAVSSDMWHVLTLTCDSLLFQGVLVGWAESSQHLVDLQQCARSLHLQADLSDLIGHSERPHVRDHLLLTVWGRQADVELAVGRLMS